MAATPSPKLGGFFLILAAAGIGYLLITLPATVIGQYDKAVRLGWIWAYLYVATVSTGVLLLVAVSGRIGLGLWRRWRHKQVDQAQAAKSPSQMSRTEKQAAISSNLQEAQDLAAQLDDGGRGRVAIDAAVDQLEAKRDSQKLEIVAFGTVSSGKSSLLNVLAGRDVFRTHPKGGTTVDRHEVAWPGADRVVLVDTPGLGEIDGVEHQRVARDAARDADLVLVVVDGPLRDSEVATLRLMAEMEKRVLVCLNKSDWYDEGEREELMEQMNEQIGSFVDKRDIVEVRAKPLGRTRVRVQTDGSESTETVPVKPDISLMAKRLIQTIRADGRDLLLANLLLQSRALVQHTKHQVEQSLDRRASQIVDRYTWRAGAVAAVVPFPAVDVAAGLTISTKMVLDLAKVYRQDIDLKVAERLLAQMGKNLVAILGSHAVTPAVGVLLGSALKTVPGIGTLSGGVVQGLTQAVVTRWIGRVFTQYFRDEMRTPRGGLTQIARQQWDDLTQAPRLVELAKAAHAMWRQGPDSPGMSQGTQEEPGRE